MKIEFKKYVNMGGSLCSITAGPTILYMRVGLEGRTPCYYYKAAQLVSI